jgi:hypothetical protein
MYSPQCGRRFHRLSVDASIRRLRNRHRFAGFFCVIFDVRRGTYRNRAGGGKSPLNRASPAPGAGKSLNFQPRGFGIRAALMRGEGGNENEN